MPKFNVFRHDLVHVMSRQCATCIFRPGQEVIPIKRRKEMVSEAVASETAIVCHHTIGTKSNAVCRGFYNSTQTLPLIMATAMDLIRFQDPE
jgi:hypothetical protein